MLGVTNYYEVLGVHKKASVRNIKIRYLELAKKFHPDKTNGDELKTKIFKKIGEAYCVLSDNSTRQEYDATLNQDYMNNLNHEFSSHLPIAKKAASSGNIQILEELLNTGFIFPDYLANIALVNRQATTLKWLLTFGGINVNAHMGYSYLIIDAVKDLYIEGLNIILNIQGIDITVIDYNYQCKIDAFTRQFPYSIGLIVTAISHAVEKGDHLFVDAILQKNTHMQLNIDNAMLPNPSPTNGDVSNGAQSIPVFIFAAKMQNHRVMRTLLQHGANVNVVDSRGRTALIHILSEYKEDITETVNIILGAGADVNIRYDTSCFSPPYSALINAVFNHKLDAIRVLLDEKNCASPTIEILNDAINESYRWNHDFLSKAEKKHRTEIIRILEDYRHKHYRYDVFSGIFSKRPQPDTEDKTSFSSKIRFFISYILLIVADVLSALIIKPISFILIAAGTFICAIIEKICDIAINVYQTIIALINRMFIHQNHQNCNTTPKYDAEPNPNEENKERHSPMLFSEKPRTEKLGNDKMKSDAPECYSRHTPSLF